MKLNKKQKKTLLNVAGYITIAGIAFGVAYPIFGLGASDKRIGGTQKVSFLSNIPKWFDGGFNELTYNGVVRYTAYSDQKLGTMGAEYSFLGTTYEEPIRNLYRNGAETITSAGFSVAGGAYSVLQEEVAKDKNFVLIDDSSLATWRDVSGYQGNAVTVTYTAHEAGFFAGLASAAYGVNEAINNKDYVAGTDINFGVWGGDLFSTVFDWMSGFEMAINWFNYEYIGYNIAGEPVATAELKDKNLGRMRIVNGGSSATKIDYTTSADQTSIKGEINGWYSGGFSDTGPENAVAEDKTRNMVDQDVYTIFPVVSPQTKTALNYVNSNKLSTQILGVDVDATLTTEKATHENILGSALKDIELGTEMGTWYADKYLAEYSNDDWTDKDNIDVLAQKDMYYKGEGKNFITKQSDDPVNGWLMKKAVKTPEAGGETVGAHFQGTFQNGAVGFSDGGQPQLETALKTLELTGIKNFRNLMDKAYNAQVQGEVKVVEKASWTFQKEAIPTTTPEHDGWKNWIPNWETYHRT